MLRSALGKVAWMARATTTVVGLAIMLALVVGVASTALGADGDFLKLGVAKNVATKATALVGKVASDSSLAVKNPSGGSALGLQVNAGKAPLTVNPDAGKATNLNADKLDGKDFSAFGAQQVIDEAGPLPANGTFTSRGGTLIVSVSGSGYRGTGSSQLEGLIAIDVRVDGGNPEFLRVYTNERNSHKAFVSEDLVFRGFASGEHDATLGRVYAASVCNTANETKDAPCTATDANDFFSVTVTEIPD